MVDLGRRPALPWWEVSENPLDLGQILGRIDRAPEGTAPVGEEPAFAGQLGKGRRLVIASVGQPVEEFSRQNVDTGVEPEGERRLFFEAYDAVRPIQPGNPAG